MTTTPDLTEMLAARRVEDQLARYLPARAGCTLFLEKKDRCMCACEGYEPSGAA